MHSLASKTLQFFARLYRTSYFVEAAISRFLVESYHLEPQINANNVSFLEFHEAFSKELLKKWKLKLTSSLQKRTKFNFTIIWVGWFMFYCSTDEIFVIRTVANTLDSLHWLSLCFAFISVDCRRSRKNLISSQIKCWTDNFLFSVRACAWRCDSLLWFCNITNFLLLSLTKWIYIMQV